MTTNNTERCYYAEFCPYDIRAISDGDRLMQFRSKAERDTKVEEINAAHSDDCNIVAQPITLRDARKRYRTQDFGTDSERECMDKTVYDRHYFEVRPK